MRTVSALLASVARTETETGADSLEIDVCVVARALLGFHGLALAVMVLQQVGAPVPEQVRVPVLFLALTFVPGGLVVLHLYVPVVQWLEGVQLQAEHVLYALGASLMSLMAIGFVLNITLPVIGYDIPMAWIPLAAAVTVFNVALAWPILRRHRDEPVSIPLVPLASPTPLAFVLLPLGSIVGVELLNRTGNNALLILVLVAVACVPLVVVTRGVSPEYHALGVWTIALAVLFHKSLWKYSGYSGQPYAIRIWKVKRWNPGVVSSNSLSAELLPNGILYPMYARLSGVHILTQYNVINPVLVSFLPVALFVTFRRHTDSYKAFLGASLFVFAHPFFRQYPTGGRAATPVLFLALFGVAISDRDSSHLVASALSLLFVLGIVVSHYGTSYYVMAAFTVALFFLVALRWFDAIVATITTKTNARDLSLSELRDMVPEPGARLSLTLVLFYSVATLTWYMFLRGGRKFDLLPKHAKESYLQLIGGSSFSGRTAARIQKDYGTEAIQYSKYLYLALAGLMAFGLLVVLYRRLSTDHTGSGDDIGFDDHYYALALAMLGIFGMTVMFRNWGGGRPMMITFVFTAVFAVVGLTAFELYTLGSDRYTVRLFGVLLVALFVLNSGVASALFLGGFAPSNVPNQHDLAESPTPRAVTTVYKETDIATHVWLIDHYEGGEVYGDTFANRQKDWYRPDINDRTEGFSSGYGPGGTIPGKPLELPTLARPGVESGYVILLGHNLALDGVWNVQYGPPRASLDELELAERDKVFTTGESAVYYYDGSGANQSDSSDVS